MIRIIKQEVLQVSYCDYSTIYTTKDFKDTDTVADIKKFLGNKIENFVGMEIRKGEKQ